MQPSKAPTSMERVLFVSKAHVYAIPPLASISRGYRAADWNVDKNSSIVFTARVRVVETATYPSSGVNGSSKPKLVFNIRLEDEVTGNLFANCPYIAESSVTATTDSSRFFALRVVDQATNRKAMLGMGFEERSDAFEFAVTLQRIQTSEGSSPRHAGLQRAANEVTKANEGNLDFSLAEGAKINITVAGKGRRRNENSFAESTGGSAFLPPPPSADSMKGIKRGFEESHSLGKKPEILGFEDDAF